MVGALFTGRGVLSGVPLTLTSGTILVIVMALILLAVDLSDVEVFDRPEDEVDGLGEGSAGPNVADDRGREGGEAGSGDRLPAFATAIATQMRERRRGFIRAEVAIRQRLGVCCWLFDIAGSVRV